MRRLISSRIAIVAIALVLCLVLSSVAAACPNCKEAMEKQDPTHGGVVKGYFYSILFMMGTPYLVLGTFCAVMYYRVRKARRSGNSPNGAARSEAASAGQRRVLAEQPTALVRESQRQPADCS
jgi:heme/copper-type cytochrome/quinol oxidase subunit 2